ncbi:MAG: CPBP family intramembrane glutamic endopeptidase [Bacteroidota bacterium]
MYNYHHRLIPDDRTPLATILLLFACVAAGYFIAAFIGIIPILPFITSIEDLSQLINDPQPDSWWAVMTQQLIVASMLFILTPYLYVKFVLQSKSSYLFTASHAWLKGILLTVVLTLSFMGFNSILVEWNSQMVLPDFMSGIEDYIRSKEDQLARLTEFLTDFQTTDKYLYTMLIIGVIPAIGEEYLFRGVLQTIFEKFIGNPHLAILLASILFSAFHFQFYGFLPRMALGMLFGYLFYYSGNLIYPMIAHFINNGLTVTVLYLHKTGVIEFDIETAETPALWTVLMFLAIGIMLMFVFRGVFSKMKSS